MQQLKFRDYMYVLRYYDESIPITRKKTINKRETKQKALKILKRKLCSCKKKLQEKNVQKNRSIAICTKSVLNDKGFSPTQPNVTCKKTRKQKLLALRKNNLYTRKKSVRATRKKTKG